jgi:hypothetical protein
MIAHPAPRLTGFSSAAYNCPTMAAKLLTGLLLSLALIRAHAGRVPERT